jgi:hypothetical protein
MLSYETVAFAAGLCLSILPAAASAQIDYRNLDDERPVTTEDAYPVEHYAFESLAPYRFERERGGGSAHLFTPEFEYGPLANTQVGLRLPIAGTNVGNGSSTNWGLAGLQLFGLYNFNTEGRRLPALSLRGDVSLPVGSLAGNDARFLLKAIATRSWGLYRLHANLARGFGRESGVGAIETVPRWAGSLAADRTFFRQSLLLVAEVAALQDVRNAPTAINVAAGARYQWTPTTVIDLGVARRLRNTFGPDFALTFGISHAFAIRGLMPAGPR